MTDRVYDRIPLSLEVEYRTAGAFLVSYTSNLSKGGLFIDTEAPLPVGTQLLLRFSIPNSAQTEPIEVRGAVAWVRPIITDGKPAGMGIEFDNLEAHHGEIIDRIVASFHGLRILVVAGLPATLSLLARAVRSILSSADIVELEDADGAERALQHGADLAIVDLDEPDAAERLYTLRLAKTRGRLPVIATSRNDKTRQRACDLGADEALPTPVIVPDLQACILRVLGRPIRVGSGDRPAQDA